MKSSIPKKWFLAICAGVLTIVGVVIVVNAVGGVRRSLVLKQTYNDLKWIGMALQQYHEIHGSFPPAVVRDANDNALHSWRSVIQTQLADIVRTSDDFRSYKFSEPWDCEANKRSDMGHRFGTHPYQFIALVGPNAAWSASGSRKLADFTDGSSNTALVVAVRNTGIRWSEPVDAVVTESGTLSVNGHPVDLLNDVFVLTADGAVRYAGHGLPNDTLSALLTIKGGDTVGGW
jgi:hypothetical protein